MDLINYHVAPVVGIIGYLNYPRDFKINANSIYLLSIFHNLVMIMFSAWTFINMISILYEMGIVYDSKYYFSNEHFDQVNYYFYLSKYYEFIDTFLLYLKNKEPIFLQKFHHVGAVVCWHLGYVYKVDAIWLPTFANSFIHTIMYTYYLSSVLKIPYLKQIKKYITSMQLIQLIIPNIISCYYYYPPVETEWNYNIVLVFISYVYVLIGLFLQFYYNNYIKTIKRN